MPPRKKVKPDVWGAAQDAAMRLHGQDLQVSEQIERERSQRTALLLEEIQARSSDTRQLRQDHVEQLAESIAVLGLLEPLVVDNQGRLLAGGHRKAAIYYIKERQPEAYEQHFSGNIVPVRMLAFNADEDPERALQVEISENEKRRDYTPAEVRALADRLRSAGYADTPGRPSKDEKRLRPALEIIIGKSLRSVRRYLTEEKPVQVGQVSKKAALRRAKLALEQWMSVVENEETTAPERQLNKKLPGLLELIEKLIEQN